MNNRGYYPNVKGKKRKMAELLVNPDCDMTVTNMCKAVGVSRGTFYNWQQEPDFRGYVQFLIDNWTDSELPRAWRALLKKIGEGNVEAMKLFFTLKEKYKEKVEIDSNVVFITGEDELPK